LAGVKGLPILLDALAELKRDRHELDLVVAGDGPDRQALVQRACDLGLASQVRFLGYQSPAQVRELLGQTDIFVMASFAEGVPVVLMEAMACSIPVVATRIAGIPELVEDGVSGFLVPPADAHSLAERITALLSDPALRQRFGKAGRAEVEAEFNIATESLRLVRILTCALDGQVIATRPEPVLIAPMPPAPMPAPAPTAPLPAANQIMLDSSKTETTVPASLSTAGSAS